MDTNRFADRQIAITAMDNANYLGWDNMKFHLSVNLGDSVKTYIHDTMISGGYRELYRLQYFSQTDEVVVVNEGRDSVWQSF